MQYVLFCIISVMGQQEAVMLPPNVLERPVILYKQDADVNQDGVVGQEDYYCILQATWGDDAVPADHLAQAKKDASQVDRYVERFFTQLKRALPEGYPAPARQKEREAFVRVVASFVQLAVRMDANAARVMTYWDGGTERHYYSLDSKERTQVERGEILFERTNRQLFRPIRGVRAVPLNKRPDSVS